MRAGMPGIAGLLVLALLAALAGAMPAAAHAGHAGHAGVTAPGDAPAPTFAAQLAVATSDAGCGPACPVPVETPCCPAVACAHATALALLTAAMAVPWGTPDAPARVPPQMLPPGRSPEQPTPPPRLPA